MEGKNKALLANQQNQVKIISLTVNSDKIMKETKENNKRKKKQKKP